ncbi:MAG: YceD family protein [Thiotrichales bacterium]|nr:YceD family protein [Thiotrichales bacterium]
MTPSLAVDTLCRLMPPDLPQTINPLRLARSDATLNGQIKIGELDRLGAVLSDTDGEVRFGLAFAQDANGRTIVTGNCSACLALKCQRCFDPMQVEISTATRLMVVNSIEAARDIPDDYEPLLFSGDDISLRQLIEDEMLLALPIAPLHETEKCNAGIEQDGVQEDYRVNPFAVLKTLKPGT